MKMKNAKILIAVLLALLSSAALSAQAFTTKTLYRTGVYGQTFELIELSDDEGCILCLFMTDNKNSNKSGVTFYDSELPTVYEIYSPYITNSKEYSKTVDACKEFFDVSMNLIYLADMKDICDIAPCCELEDYSVKQFENGENIFILNMTARI